MEDIIGNLENPDEDMDQSEIQSRLSTMSFEDLQKLKEDLGLKIFNEACFGAKSSSKTNFKRLNKNRPREASSKIKPKFSLPTKRKNIRDPRFDTLCGSFDKDTFEKNYSFLNDIRKKEKEELKNMLQNEKDEVKTHKIKYLLQRMNNQERERLRREKKQSKLQEERREQVKAFKSGKKPYFKSKYERKIEDVIDKYEELKKSGKLLKYIEKKQKKNRSKHKKYFQNESSKFSKFSK